MTSDISKVVREVSLSTTSPASVVDPLKSRRAQAVLKGMRKVCLALPETAEDLQLGVPVWRAGKKAFASIYYDQQRLTLSFWVGVERQAMMTREERFRIPLNLGHNGWIALDVTDECEWDEVYELALNSYRHFALKRMLAALPASLRGA
ncbi:MAG: MmcQ/YjbR family DNA-binding protein [Steroidobacteraceae bacterium]